MTIYVDDAIFMTSPKGRVKYCHMVADSLEELHTFAERIGVKRHFYHSKTTYPHFDVREDQRVTALVHGAVSTSSKEIIRISANMIPHRTREKTAQDPV